VTGVLLRLVRVSGTVYWLHCVTLTVFTASSTAFEAVNITFIGFGSQEGWITTDIKTYITNNKTVSTHQLSDESQSATEFNTASPVQSINQIRKMR